MFMRNLNMKDEIQILITQGSNFEQSNSEFAYTKSVFA